MVHVGNVLHQIAYLFSHGLRNVVAIVGFQDISYTALARLAVDPDDVRLVNPIDIMRVDRYVRHIPLVGSEFLSVVHALCDGVLVRTGESCKYQLSAVRLSRVHFHISELFIHIHYVRHVGEVELRVYAVGKQVHRHSHYVHVARPFSVAEEGSFNSVSSCQESQLAVRHCRSPVVVRVQGNYHVFSRMEIF